MTTDRKGRAYDPLIHETGHDGQPALTKDRKYLKLKRGAQGIEGERLYAEKMAQANSVAADPAPAADPVPVAGDPGDGGPGGAGPAPAHVMDDAGPVAGDEIWLPGTATSGGAEDHRHDSGADTSDGGRRGLGLLGLFLLGGFFILGVIGGKKWRTTPEDDRKMGINPGDGRATNVFYWLRVRFWDQGAIGDLREGFGRIRSWIAGPKEEEQKTDDVQATP